MVMSEVGKGPSIYTEIKAEGVFDHLDVMSHADE
jgi:hypothetical protein